MIYFNQSSLPLFWTTRLKSWRICFFFRQHSSCDNIWHIHCLQTGTFILEKAIKSFKSHRSSCICSCTSLRFHVKKKESESQSFIHQTAVHVLVIIFKPKTNLNLASQHAGCICCGSILSLVWILFSFVSNSFGRCGGLVVSMTPN